MNNWEFLSELEALKVKVYKALCDSSIRLEDTFEYAIFFNSSEERTLEYQKVLGEKSIENVLLVDFKNDSCLFKEKNLRKNLDYLTIISQNKPKVLGDLDIFNYESNLETILNEVPSNLSKCFIEITGVPLLYSIAILRPLLLSFPSPSLYFLNVSANYDNGGNKNYQFSDGLKENIYIPGYYGRPDFSKPWIYIFLLGFEGTRSISILKQNQPDYIKAIIAEPGYQNDYNTKAIEINKAFLSEAHICNNEIIRIDAGNPVEICNCIIDIYNDFKEDANICLVPLGTKPHALGAGMAALLRTDIAIMYQVPKRYSINNTKSGKYLWLYKFN